MIHILNETNKYGRISFLAIIEAIKRNVAQKCDRELAGRIISGEGNFLDRDLVVEIRENLSKATALVRLVENGLRIGEDRDNFSRNPHVAMRLAVKELGVIVQIIKENAPPKDQPQEMKPPGLQDYAS